MLAVSHYSPSLVAPYVCASTSKTSLFSLQVWREKNTLVCLKQNTGCARWICLSAHHTLDLWLEISKLHRIPSNNAYLRFPSANFWSSTCYLDKRSLHPASDLFYFRTVVLLCVSSKPPEELLCPLVSRGGTKSRYVDNVPELFGVLFFCTTTSTVQLQEQVQAKALQELMTQMTDQCFNKCAKTSGGERLTSSEQGCLAMCMDRCVI